MSDEAEDVQKTLTLRKEGEKICRTKQKKPSNQEQYVHKFILDFKKVFTYSHWFCQYRWWIAKEFVNSIRYIEPHNSFAPSTYTQEIREMKMKGNLF